MRNNKAFTLIELLVVVLIIGILSAVALPQYQKTVWKSRSVQLQTAARSLATAQEAYFLANGEYANDFDVLDLSFDHLSSASTSSLGLHVTSTNAVRRTNEFELVVNVSHTGLFLLSSAVFRDGTYKGGGFMFVHDDPDGVLKKKLYCVESQSWFALAQGSFCGKMFNATNNVSTKWGYRFYEMP
ncbi:type IV pilin protein [Candidatus Avelusimicrobium luingense]|uniref:type IV pilin protein n=1 Tax=Candidatus Avelusimicrobium luingense TaxID=3416211 RepID=UPI003D149D45